MTELKKLFLATVLAHSLFNLKIQAMEPTEETVQSIWSPDEKFLYIIKDDGVVIPCGQFPKNPDELENKAPFSEWSRDGKFLYMTINDVIWKVGPFPADSETK